MKGGADTGFRHVKPEEYQPRLLHFCGTRKNVVVKEVRGCLSTDLYRHLCPCVWPLLKTPTHKTRWLADPKSDSGWHVKSDHLSKQGMMTGQWENMVEPTMDLSIHFFEMLTQKQFFTFWGKKIWNRVDCQRSEKKIQNSQEIKWMLFNWTKHHPVKKRSFNLLHVLDLWLPEQYWCISTTYEVL